MKLFARLGALLLCCTLGMVGLPAQAEPQAPHPTPPMPRKVLRHLSEGHDDTVPPPASWRVAPGTLRKPPAVIKAVVVPLYWDAAPPEGEEFTEASLTALLGQVGGWFHRVSRGKQTMTSTVLPWQKINFNPCDSLSAAAKAAMAKVVASGRSMRSFNRLVVMDPQCNANSSWGQMPGKVTWIQFGPTLEVLVHELGHNLGLRHANSQICTAPGTDVRVPWSTACQRQVYGDVWDAMGISKGPYSVPILKKLGWAGLTQRTSTPGTYTLTAAENSGAGVQGLEYKISRKVSYWFEYRTDPNEVWFDPTEAVTGVQVRRTGAKRAYDIFDGTPGNPVAWAMFPDADLSNPALTVGQTVALGDGLGVKVISQDSTSAVIQLIRPFSAPAPNAPTLQSAVVRNSGWGNTLTATWQQPVDNGAQIVGYQVSAGGTTVSAPASATSVSIDAVAGGAEVKVRAVGASGSSAWSNVIVARLAAPSMTVTAPAEGATLDAYDLTFTGTATPDPLSQAALGWVTVAEDGLTIASDAASAAWTVTAYDPPAAGAHTYVITVSDDTGATASVTRHLTLTHADVAPVITAPVSGATLTSDPATISFSMSRFDRMSQWSGLEVLIDGSVHDTCYPSAGTGTCSVNLSGLADGGHTMQLQVQDVYGQLRTSPTISFTLNLL